MSEGRTPEAQWVTPAITHNRVKIGGHKYEFHQWTPKDPKR
jgi:hypothetical protein